MNRRWSGSARAVAIAVLASGLCVISASTALAYGTSRNARTLKGALVTNSGNAPIGFRFTLKTTRSGSSLAGDPSLIEQVNLPPGFSYNGGIFRSGNVRFGTQAFTNCGGRDANKNGVPDRFEGTADPGCPPASQVGDGAATAVRTLCSFVDTQGFFVPGSYSPKYDVDHIAMQIFNGGGSVRGGEGVLFVRAVVPAAIDNPSFRPGEPARDYPSFVTAFRIKFKDASISYVLPDSLVSRPPTHQNRLTGDRAYCFPQIDSVLKLYRKTAVQKRTVHKRGRAIQLTFVRGLFESGPCKAPKGSTAGKWTFLNAFEATDGSGDEVHLGKDHGNLVRDPANPAITFGQSNPLVRGCRA